MINSKLSDEALLKLLRHAAQDLANGGKEATSWYYELKYEVLKRMASVKGAEQNDD